MILEIKNINIDDINEFFSKTWMIFIYTIKSLFCPAFKPLQASTKVLL